MDINCFHSYSKEALRITGLGEKWVEVAIIEFSLNCIFQNVCIVRKGGGKRITSANYWELFWMQLKMKFLTCNATVLFTNSLHSLLILNLHGDPWFYHVKLYHPLGFQNVTQSSSPLNLCASYKNSYRENFCKVKTGWFKILVSSGDSHPWPLAKSSGPAAPSWNMVRQSFRCQILQ